MVKPSEVTGGQAERPIAFGTSGWRGIRGVDFDLPRVAIAVSAFAHWLAERAPGSDVVIAHDTRPGGDAFADEAARILAARGFGAVVARGAVPTPAAVHASRSRGAAAAIVFTASHNPPEYAGMKVFGADGGILDPAASARIETLAGELARDGAVAAPGSARRSRPIERVDVVAPYLDALLAFVDRGAFAAGRLEVVYDAMHAAGAGVLDAALRRLGARVRTLRAEPDAAFGGGAPDPSDARLGELAAVVRAAREPMLAVATDGDADRFAVLGDDGRCLQATDALALLVDHLAASGRIERGVAISLATGTLVERVAAAHGLRVERHPIGFKYLSRALESGAADCAGEESGGFALAQFGRDKDGVLAGLLFAEMLAAGGPSLDERLGALRRRYGTGVCGRSAVRIDATAAAALADLAAAPPERLDESRVARVTHADGVHFALADGFLMLRGSGTEPLLRIYAEAPDPERLERRLAAGRSLLSRHGSQSAAC